MLADSVGRGHDRCLDARTAAITPVGDDAAIGVIQLHTKDVSGIGTAVGGHPAHAVIIELTAGVGLEVHLEVDAQEGRIAPGEGLRRPGEDVGCRSKANRADQAISSRGHRTTTAIVPIGVCSNSVANKAGFKVFADADERRSLRRGGTDYIAVG